MKCDNCRTELPNSKGETLKCPECGEEYEDSEEQESSPQNKCIHKELKKMEILCLKCGECMSINKLLEQAREEMLKEEEKIFQIINEKLSRCAFFEHLNYKQQEELELTINDIKKLWKQNRFVEGEKKC